MPAVSESVLYYPTIEFTTDMWLKHALCVWDNVYRIVPSGYSPTDSDDVRKATDAGLVRDIRLSSQDLEEAAEDFEAFTNGLDFLPAGLEANEETVRLFSEKVDARILPKLKKLASHVGRQGALELPRQVANGYMLLLAETVARRRCLPKATDDPDMHAVLPYYAHDGNFDEQLYNAEATEFMASALVPTIMPGGLEFAPIEKILSLHKEAAEGRTAFRNAIAEFSECAARIEDARHRSDLVKDFESKLRTANTAREASLKRLFGQIGFSLLCVGLPVGVRAVRALHDGSDPYDPADICAGVTIGAVAAFIDVSKARKRRASWSANENAYFLQLGKIGRDAVGRITYSSPRFDRILIPP